MALIAAKDLAVGFGSQVVADKIDFEINSGDFVCIVGENGSGKSTLVKTIMSLLPPISGHVVLGEGLKRTEMGYLGQQTDVQRDFPASVEEIVLSGCLNSCGKRPFFNRQDRKLAEANMVRTGVLNLRRRCYRELSGGQQQRVLLARALCASTRVILLDEPVTGLDPVASAEMYRILADLNSSGMTIVMVSHDIAPALEHATKVLDMGKETVMMAVEDYHV